MKRIIFFITLVLFLMNAITAQSISKFTFHSISSAGLLQGGSDNNLQLQTINGVNYKSFFAGIGVGLDNYSFKTIPLFFDVRKNIKNTKQTPFVYADVGAGFPWDKSAADAFSKSNFKTGFFYDMGIGYTIPLKGRWAFNISAGFSKKFLKERREETRWLWLDYVRNGTSASYIDTSNYGYTFRRLSFKIGISF